MALIATHIRFALDLLEKYNVANLDKYISGTLYPDSRYISNLDRGLTHSVNNFAIDCDFRNGWLVHVYCDSIQSRVIKERFPNFFSNERDEFDKFIMFSVIRIIQDINDLKYLDIKKYLKYLDYICSPNNEKREDIKKIL